MPPARDMADAMYIDETTTPAARLQTIAQWLCNRKHIKQDVEDQGQLEQATS